QRLVRGSDAHLLARCAGSDTALPVEPVRTAHDAVLRPAFLAIELREQLQEAVGCRVDVAVELGHLHFDVVHALPVRADDDEQQAGEGGGHGEHQRADYKNSIIAVNSAVAMGYEASSRPSMGYRYIRAKKPKGKGPGF